MLHEFCYMKKAYFLILIVVMVVFGCTHPSTSGIENQCVGFLDLTPVVCLIPDHTSISVYEMIGNNTDVDSIAVSNGAKVYFSQDRQHIHVSGYDQLSVGFFELKIWQKSIPTSVLLRNVAQKENLAYLSSHKNTLGINTSNFTLKRIMIAYDLPVDEWFVLWNNQRLSKRLYASGNGMLTIYIPREASAIRESYIRVCGQSGGCVSDILIIPLVDGAVVKNSDHLLPYDIHHALIYQFDTLCFDRDIDRGKRNDIVCSDPGRDINQTDIKALFPPNYFEQLHVSDFLYTMNRELWSEKFGNILSKPGRLADLGLYNATFTAFAGSGKEGFVLLSGMIDSILQQNAGSRLRCFYSGYPGMPRFMSRAGSVRQSNDRDGSALTFPMEITDLSGYDRAASHMAFLMTIPGMPVLYQSDEIGITGGDRDSYYRAMKYDNLSPEEKNLLEKTRYLTYLRRNNLVLQYGDFQTLLLEKDVWVYIRRYFSHAVVVFFNRSSQPTTIQVSLPDNLRNLEFYNHYGKSPEVEGNTMFTDLNPYSFEIFMN